MRLIAALGISQIIGWGTTYYALGVLAYPIAADTGWSPGLVFAGLSVALLAGGAVATPIGRATDRIGARTVLCWGSVLAAAGLAVVAVAPNRAVYLLGWLLIGPVMRMALYDAAFAALVQVTGRRARRSISYLTLYGGLASSVFWPIGHVLGEALGWRGALAVYALLNLAVCLPLHLLVPKAPLPVAEDANDSGSSGEHSGSAPAAGERWRSAVVLFAAMVTLNSIVFSSLSAHMVSMLETTGLAAATAVSVAALKGVFQVVGRIGEILLGRNLAATDLGRISVGLLPAGLAAWFLAGEGLVPAVVFVVLYGLSNGLVTIARGALPLHLFGAEGYGTMLGLVSMPQLVASALAPPLFALLLDRTSVHVGIGVLLAVAVASSLAMEALARRFAAAATSPPRTRSR